MKSIHDQIIESVCDGDIVKELLQENNLTLATGIAKSHSKEATKSIVWILKQLWPYVNFISQLIIHQQLFQGTDQSCIWEDIVSVQHTVEYVPQGYALCRRMSISRPNSRLAVHNSILVQGLSGWSHTKSVEKVSKAMQGVNNGNRIHNNKCYTNIIIHLYLPS